MDFDAWLLVDRFGGAATLVVAAALWFHVGRCERRKEKIWDRLDKLDGDLGKLNESVAYIKGKMDDT